ncbi:anhydro-N-acetylmuramic acid kinase [Maribacter sp. 2307ULW6-5]|uniref:anhydro-N-acetylmuramic acid kinase n=1 Tax=Maribacter sp. 2307ULW6-5 TaxID=3386275 RepID=UPI0039BCEEA1
MEHTKTFNILGLMSGTSLDGLDLCYCHIWKKQDQWTFEILQSESRTYPKGMRSRLKHAIELPSEELLQFHNSYGTWLGRQSKDFLQKHKLQVDAIASHGHTVHHRPEQGLTFQLGSGQHLANTSGNRVVCDFRTNDVALGGQGAPLVPIGDRLFFSEYDQCLNLGGISNISFEMEGRRVAYDIGLANMALNHLTRKIDLEYDENGNLAASGRVNAPLLEKLNALAYYQLPFPKSTGYEWFTDEVVPLLDTTPDRMENLLHTTVHHICDQIALQLEKYRTKDLQRMLVTGGGALNGFLISTLREKLGARTEVVVPSKTLIDYKEALIFALMGALRLAGETNVLRSVTGAERDSCSGVVHFPELGNFN